MSTSRVNEGMFTSRSDDWWTPPDLFAELDDEFHFTLDPCASPENAKCSRFFTEVDNGLAQSWDGEVVFCNPPYSNVKEWVYKAAASNAVVVMLIPARTDTRWFHSHIYNKTEVRFLKGRLRFSNAKWNLSSIRRAAPFPSMIVVFNKHLMPSEPRHA